LLPSRQLQLVLSSTDVSPKEKYAGPGGGKQLTRGGPRRSPLALRRSVALRQVLPRALQAAATKENQDVVIACFLQLLIGQGAARGRIGWRGHTRAAPRALC
jgi:hypothetical protein